MLKRLLGLDSPYSWVKYIRIGGLAVGIIGILMLSPILFQLGPVLAILLLVLFGGPILLLLLLVLGGITTIIVSATTISRNKKSLKASAEADATELARRSTQDPVQMGQSVQPSISMVELDRLRIKAQTLTMVKKILYKILGAMLVLTGFIANFGNAIPFVIILVVSIILAAILQVNSSKAKSAYDQIFKETIVITGLESVLQNMQFDPKSKLDDQVVKNCNLFSGYDAVTGNDLLTADYQGRHFTQSDIKLTETHEETYEDKDGDLQTRNVTTKIFQGTIMVFDFDALSNVPVYVFDKHMRSIPKDPIQTESTAFNQRFWIKSEDPVSAFRMLTPQVIEGLVLSSQKAMRPFSLAFKDDILYIALSGGDSFEATIEGDATLAQQRQRIKDEILAMLGVVDSLYLVRKRNTH
ncbi:MAG: DUF3137 domain-containing protein [Clostridium sp.]|nr:DUF3137 domain-containing protein [Clostridium sp.]